MKKYEKWIKLIFKEKLNQEVEKLIEKSKGYDNIIYIVKTKDSEYIIRFPRKAPSWMPKDVKEVVKNRLSAEAYANNIWGKLGVPVPKTILIDITRKLIDSDYLIQERIKGKDLGESKLTNKQKKGIMRELGEYARKMHSVKTKGYGYMKKPGVGDSETWKEFNDKDFKGNFREVEKYKVIPKNILAKAYKIYSQNKAILNYKDPRLLHNDLGADNIIIYKGKLSGIIDTSDIISGDPMYELGVMSNYYLGTDLMEYFYKSYGKVNIKKICLYAIIHSMWMINFRGYIDKNKKELKHYTKSLNYHLNKLGGM